MAQNNRIQSLDPNPRAGTPRKGTLAALVGTAAAAILFTQIPREESGRVVETTIAPDGAATVKHVSGKQYLQAYLDIAGIPTACDGIIDGVRLGQRYTPEQCTALLERELIEHVEGAMKCSSGLRAPGRDYQRAAAGLLTYNIGIGGFCNSNLRKKFDAGDIRGACDGFLAWDKARVKGVLRPVRGLTDRRKRERAMCLKGL